MVAEKQRRPGQGAAAMIDLDEKISAQSTSRTLKGKTADALTRYAAARAAWEREPTPENNQRRLGVLAAVAAAHAAPREAPQ
jgi:hypothetical protein